MPKVKRYRKRPVEIEAMLYDSSEFFAFLDLQEFVGKSLIPYYLDPNSKDLYIQTLEGNMRISDGDFVIKGTKGEFYPCKPDIFLNIHEEIVPLAPLPIDPAIHGELPEEKEEG